MKLALLAGALLFALSPAFADDQTSGLVMLPGGFACTTIPCIPDTKNKPTPMVITSIFEVFRMEDGACLRGPLVIRDGAGSSRFELSAGADFPAGCSKAFRQFVPRPAGPPGKSSQRQRSIMNDNLKMVGRYAITAAVAYAVGKGWVKADQSSDVTNAMIQIGGALAALAPAFYAWFKVDNTPKT